MSQIHEILAKIGIVNQNFDSGLAVGAAVMLITIIVILVVIKVCSGVKSRSEKIENEVEDKSLEEIKKLKAEIKAINEDTKQKLELRFNDGALYSLVLLQREGRFVDFIQEDISSFEDEQIGAAVRQIHTGCKKVLNENFNVTPLFDQVEGDKVALEEDFDPTTVKLSGNIPSKAPYNGVLRHKGWKSKSVKLPKITGKVNPKIVCPAEIEF